MGNCLGSCLSVGRSNSMRRSTDEQDELVPPTSEETSGRNIIFKIIKFKKKKRPQFIDTFLERNQSPANYSRLNQATSLASSEIQLQCLDAQNLLLSTNTRDTALNNNSVAYGVGSSRASSSLDLEWEHEYGNRCNSLNQWYFLPEDISSRIRQKTSNNNNDEQQSGAEYCDETQSICNSINLMGSQNLLKQAMKQNQSTPKMFTRASSRTSWSHISTPESLEWDIDEDQQKQMKVEDDNLDHETLELLHQIEVLKNKVLDETGEALEINDHKIES